MKFLSFDNFLKAPRKVQAIQCLSIYSLPVSSDLFNEAINEHPEYFPEEVEARRKWALIPQSVHDEYLKEVKEMRVKVYKDVVIEAKGIGHYMHHPDEYDEFLEKREKYFLEEMRLAEVIHQKYYAQYGIKWHGF